MQQQHHLREAVARRRPQQCHVPGQPRLCCTVSKGECTVLLQANTRAHNPQPQTSTDGVLQANLLLLQATI